MKKFTSKTLIILSAIGGKLLSIFLKLIKSAKIIKLALFGSSVVAYSYLFTWQFAIMLLGMIFIHESGHVWAMKKRNIPTKGIYFLPFMGAVAVAEDSFGSYENESYIAIMGPIWGFGACLILACLYYTTNNPIFAAGASWTALINLINLLPINPLDGGRIIKSISFSISSKLGLILLIATIIFSYFAFRSMHLGLFTFILILGIIDMFGDYINEHRHNQRTKERNDFKNIEKRYELIKQTCSKLVDNFTTENKELFDYDFKTKTPTQEDIHFLEMFVEDPNNREEATKAKFVRTSCTIGAHILYYKDQETIKSAKPKMTKQTISWIAISYATIIYVLYLFMNSMKHIPGADIALNTLK